MRDDDSKSENQGQCPSLEVLSSYFDGELDGSTDVAGHIAHCRDCAERMRDFAEFAAKLKEELQSVCDEGFAESLLFVLRKKVKSGYSDDSSRFPLFLKVAAMFAGAAMVVFSLISDDHALSSSASSSSKVDPVVFIGDGDSNAKALTSLPVPSTESPYAPSTVDISDLTPVGTCPTRPSFIDTRKEPRNFKKPEPIMSTVRQTWSVSDLKTAEREFKRMLPGYAEVSVSRVAGDSLALHLVLSKKELAELVGKCSAAGFDLLSPTQPQPEQKVFEGDGSTKVSYTAVLVPR